MAASLLVPSPQTLAIEEQVLINQSFSTGTTIVNTPITTSSLGLSAPGHQPYNQSSDNRHFIFILKDNINNQISTVKLNINPEDFVLEEPYRVNAVQTKGGAFIDIWDRGIRRLVLRGNTGWHTQVASNPTQTQDGFDNFFNIKDQIVNKYFTIRDVAITTNSSSYIDQNLTLTIIDLLNSRSYDVVPEYFRSLRNKSRPQLLVYESSFILRTPNSTTPLDPLSSIQNTSVPAISNQLGLIATVLTTIGTTLGIAGPAVATVLTNMVEYGIALCNAFTASLNGQTSVGVGAANLASQSTQITQAITTGIRSLENTFDINGIPAEVQLLFWDIKQNFADLACLLEHIQSQSDSSLTTYTGIVDSSACSAAYGMTQSTLDTTTNSFNAINSLSNGSNSTMNNSISSSSLTLVNSINSTDVPLSMT